MLNLEVKNPLFKIPNEGDDLHSSITDNPIFYAPLSKLFHESIYLC